MDAQYEERRGWIKQRLIRFAGTHSFSHGVVDFENDTPGAILAVFLLVFALNDYRKTSLCQDDGFKTLTFTQRGFRLAAHPTFALQEGGLPASCVPLPTV